MLGSISGYLWGALPAVVCVVALLAFDRGGTVALIGVPGGVVLAIYNGGAALRRLTGSRADRG